MPEGTRYQTKKSRHACLVDSHHWEENVAASRLTAARQTGGWFQLTVTPELAQRGKLTLVSGVQLYRQRRSTHYATRLRLMHLVWGRRPSPRVWTCMLNPREPGDVSQTLWSPENLTRRLTLPTARGTNSRKRLYTCTDSRASLKQFFLSLKCVAKKHTVRLMRDGVTVCCWTVEKSRAVGENFHRKSYTLYP